VTPSFLPAWASPDHPIVRRELQQWRRRTQRWRGLLLILFSLLPTCAAGLCALMASPILIEIFNPANANDAGQIASALFLIGGMILTALWVFSSILSFGLSLLRSIGASTLIAAERETQNWQLLRLTSLSVEDILRAKLAGLWHWLMLPTLLILLLRFFSLFLTGLVVVLVTAFLLSLSAANSVVQLQTWAYVLSAVVGFGLYYVLEMISSLLYDCGVGLLASAYSRTSASAVGVTFALNFGLNLFIFAPLQQVVAAMTSIFGGLASVLTNSPFFFIALTTLATSALQIFLLLATAIGSYTIALNQARNLYE
jgi:hypothetical protein